MGDMESKLIRLWPTQKRDERATEACHPCLNAQAHGTRARMHLPVAPACNIGCRFCTRNIGVADNRPGVAEKLVMPNEAVGYVAQALELCPELSVVGVAGPGDALATNHALEALSQVSVAFPDLVICLSTNGLRLPDRIEEIDDAGVGSLTVTVNAVDPEILQHIVGWTALPGLRAEGLDAARTLIDAQLRGIREARARGIVIKINTVLVPGVNDHHIGEIARTVRALGANRYNVMPLIPNGELAHIAAPDCQDVEAARAQAAPHIEVFRHCRQCRADALGVVGGEDLSARLYGGATMATFSHG
jgi:nitrogen fixation protein NifB